MYKRQDKKLDIHPETTNTRWSGSQIRHLQILSCLCRSFSDSLFNTNISVSVSRFVLELRPLSKRQTTLQQVTSSIPWYLQSVAFDAWPRVKTRQSWRSLSGESNLAYEATIAVLVEYPTRCSRCFTAWKSGSLEETLEEIDVVVAFEKLLQEAGCVKQQAGTDRCCFLTCFPFTWQRPGKVASVTYLTTQKPFQSFPFTHIRSSMLAHRDLSTRTRIFSSGLKQNRWRLQLEKSFLCFAFNRVLS